MPLTDDDRHRAHMDYKDRETRKLQVFRSICEDLAVEVGRSAPDYRPALRDMGQTFEGSAFDVALQHSTPGESPST